MNEVKLDEKVFGTRITRALLRADYKTLEDVKSAFLSGDIYKIRGIGDSSVAKIKKILVCEYGMNDLIPKVSKETQISLLDRINEYEQELNYLRGRINKLILKMSIDRQHMASAELRKEDQND